MRPRSSDGMQRDVELSAALRALCDEPPAEAVDWERLRAEIRDRAALPLAGRRVAPRPRVPAWVWPVVPAAVAASALLVLVLQPDSAPLPDGGNAAGAGGLRPVAEEILGAPIPEREWELLVAGQVDSDALVLAAVGAPPLPDP